MNPFFIFFIGIICFHSAFGQCDRNKDSLALVAIYQNCLGDGWTNKTNWLVPGKPISTWYGVKLNASGCVESISMPTNKMNGALPAELGDLQALKLLNLSNNNLSGNLPTSIGKLIQCEEINLSSNKLNGPIHSTFANLVKLKRLQLSLNNLSGNLPSGIGGMKELVILHINQNVFNGPLPASIGNLSKLEELLLSQNLFSGSLPLELGNLPKLRSLIISQNQFTGALPSELAALTQLQFFYADENQFTGNIPVSWASLKSLKELWLHRNLLSGVLPTTLTDMTGLQKLLLNQNQFSGPIPAQIGNLKSLISLHIADNKLSGSIPASIGNLSQMISFLANNNTLSGVIPSELGNCTSLNTLNISDNQLSGELPSSLGRLTNLKRIYMQNNRLIGCFPITYQRFCTLGESTNPNANGTNFRGNTQLIFSGDFGRWCLGEGRAKAAIQANTPLCEGSDLSLNGSGGVNYSWTGPGGFTSNLANPVLSSIGQTQFGTYRLAVENENLCRDTVYVTVEQTGNVTAGGSSRVCEGDTIFLRAGGGISYRWVGPLEFASTLQNPVLPNAVPAMQGDYLVEITTADCLIRRTVTVEFGIKATLSSNSPVCQGDTLRIEADKGTLFQWTGPAGFNSQSREILIPNASINAGGSYAVTVADAGGCRVTLKQEVVVKEKIVPNTESPVSVCKGEQQFFLPGEVGGFQGAWSGPGIRKVDELSYFIPEDLTGNVLITFTPDKNQGCVASANVEIQVTYVDLALLNVIPSRNDADSDGQALIEIKGNSRDFIMEYSGPDSGRLTLSSPRDLLLSDLSSGEYNVIISDSSGCRDTVLFQIGYVRPVVNFPNMVYAGSTSGNASFFVQGENIDSYSMDVYNRWGNLLFSEKNLVAGDPTQGWKPTEGLEGVYIWFARVETYFGTKEFTGTVTVID